MMEDPWVDAWKRGEITRAECESDCASSLQMDATLPSHVLSRCRNADKGHPELQRWYPPVTTNKIIFFIYCLSFVTLQNIKNIMTDIHIFRSKIKNRETQDKFWKILGGVFFQKYACWLLQQIMSRDPVRKGPRTCLT